MVNLLKNGSNDGWVQLLSIVGERGFTQNKARHKLGIIDDDGFSSISMILQIFSRK